MAYDNNGARIGAAGHFASRITAALITSGQISKAEASDTFADLTADCLAVLNGLEGGSSAENVIRANFPGTETVATPPQSGGGLRVIGGDGTPVPEWLAADAAKKGVTAVYDNRADLAQNPKRPWFKQAEPKADEPAAFWPPRR